METFLRWYLIGLVPMAATLGLAGALLVWRSARLSDAARRKWVPDLAYGPLLGSLGLYVPSALACATWGLAGKLMPWWAFFVVPALTVAVAVTLGCVVTQRCPGAPDEPDLTDVASHVRSARVCTWFGVAVFGALALWVLGGRALVFDGHVSITSVIFPAIMGPVVQWWMFVRPVIQPAADDAALTERAAELAGRMRARYPTVRLVDSENARKHPYALIRGREPAIYLSRRLVDGLAPAELDWVLCHELAHVTEGPVARMRRASNAMAGALVLQFLAVGLPLLSHVRPGASPALLALLAGLPGLCIVLLFRQGNPLARRIEYEADGLAVEATGDVEAALSALAKLVEQSPNPKAHEREFGEDHPKVSKRIRALRLAAEERGWCLSDNGADRPDDHAPAART